VMTCIIWIRSTELYLRRSSFYGTLNVFELQSWLNFGPKKLANKLVCTEQHQI
jgi:hypothetical protein